jgi:hypothetical protein
MDRVYEEHLGARNPKNAPGVRHEAKKDRSEKD